MSSLSVKEKVDKMNIAIIGSGGREHAFAYRLAMDENVKVLDVIPGNAGMMYSSDKIKSFNVSTSGTEFKNLIKHVKERSIDLVIIGPEIPLANGIVDKLEKENINVLGPSQLATQLESSKLFAKIFMLDNSIPTAKYQNFSTVEAANTSLENWPVEEKGIVIKASALAGGKGVVVTKDREIAKQTIYDFLVNPDCTVKTKDLIFEEMLHGKEVSVFALLDGDSFTMLGYACDYKRLLDNDKGPNTGGMGCYSPKTWPTQEQKKIIEKNIIEQTLTGMKAKKIPFKGFLFVGLMIDESVDAITGIKVIEYNVRFGDPEAQTLLPLLEGNLSQVLYSAAKKELSENCQTLSLSEKSAVHVVMTSEGYPSTDGTVMNLDNKIIFDKDLIPKLPLQSKQLYFAGVKSINGKITNSGGRVLGLTAIADEITQARDIAYQEIQNISFQGGFYRKDIGKNV
jgi:phosphoribosylamine--glycine ligase